MNNQTPPPQKAKLRQQIIRFLHRELIGPDPIQPLVDPRTGEEILDNDPPRIRYGAGILFPQECLMESTKSAAFGDEISTETIREEDERNHEPIQEEDGFLGGGDGVEELDEITSLTNAYFPSAMGFSCLVKIPKDGLFVEIKAATYVKFDVLATRANGKEYRRRRFQRIPFSITVPLPPTEILSNEDISVYNHDLQIEDKQICLQIRSVSRPVSKGADFRLLTLALINTHKTIGKSALNEQCFFQVEMKLYSFSDNIVFFEYPSQVNCQNEEEASLALLYRHCKTYAIGHGCAANWNEVNSKEGANSIWCEVIPVHEVKPIVPYEIPGLSLSMISMSDRGENAQMEYLLTSLCDYYDAWIKEQASIIKSLELKGDLIEAANRHLSNCRQCLKRMRKGLALLIENQEVRYAFQLANRAMLEQQLHYALGTSLEEQRVWTEQDGLRKIEPMVQLDLENPPPGKGTWYPFQIAFLLMNLSSLSCVSDEERKIVDLIWFPTGGGKTEAYLGLTAFTIILRRLRNPEEAGTSVVMRYTLRLLTAQQFQRAASLICSLEKMRRDGYILSNQRILIGLWVGNDLTPNKREEATKLLNTLSSIGDRGDNKFIVLNCPWCGAAMGPVTINDQVRIIGYKTESKTKTVVFYCGDPSCYFHNVNLPMCVIDEDLYAHPPTLLLGTVDKFAMLPWEPAAKAFFGLAHNYQPPDMIIQDELHLISGPLGSMVGHYETIVSELCSRKENKICIGPKIIASTATIARANEQCHALWNCGPDGVFLFPPQCLKAGDSFFAYETNDKPGRMYVGVHASALGSHVSAQVRVIATLLQAPLSLDVTAESDLDPYWTLVSYYNSLRELGHAATLLRADIRDHLNAMWRRLCITKPNVDEREKRRFINRDIELTSRIASSRVSDALRELFFVYPKHENILPVDIALATNMISVGVDVPRLSLMAIAGQPKTTSEYIQATSRVGRKHPGLVVMIYNTGKPRDRSHYEHFHSYHSAMYRAVEPTSITPFSSPVRERALHALLVTLARYRGSDASQDRPVSPNELLRREIISIIDNRVSGVDLNERDATIERLREHINHWIRVTPQRYGDFGVSADGFPLMYPAGSTPAPEWEGKSWPTPTSMRNVDATCEAQVLGNYPFPEND